MAIAQLPKDLLSETAGVIVDAGNYYPSRDGNIHQIDDGVADSEWVGAILGKKVVKAFNNIVADSLANSGLPPSAANRICLSVFGDESESKKPILGLIEAIGFDAVDAGILSESWRQQPGAPAYCKNLPKDDLLIALAQANPELIPVYRAKADEAARPYFGLEP